MTPLGVGLSMRVLGRLDRGHRLVLRQDFQSPLYGLAAATIPKPTVAQYAQYFRYLEVGILANSFGPYKVWYKSRTAHIPTPQFGAARQKRSPSAA
jgi:hypothetical protein